MLEGLPARGKKREEAGGRVCAAWFDTGSRCGKVALRRPQPHTLLRRTPESSRKIVREREYPRANRRPLTRLVVLASARTRDSAHLSLPKPGRNRDCATRVTPTCTSPRTHEVRCAQQSESHCKARPSNDPNSACADWLENVQMRLKLGALHGAALTRKRTVAQPPHHHSREIAAFN